MYFVESLIIMTEKENTFSGSSRRVSDVPIAIGKDISYSKSKSNVR
jgi:hypothetical protein